MGSWAAALILGLPSLRSENLRDLLTQRGTAILGRFPHHVPVDPKIRMDENVAETDDPSPRDLRAPVLRR